MGQIESIEAVKDWQNYTDYARGTESPWRNYREWESSVEKEAETGVGSVEVEESIRETPKEAVIESVTVEEKAREILKEAHKEAETREILKETHKEAEPGLAAAMQDQPSPAPNHEFVRSRSQKTNQIAPVNIEGAAKEVKETSFGPYRNIVFSVIFVVHILAVTVGIFYLGVMFVIDWDSRRQHTIKHWYPQLAVVVVVGCLFAGAWQTMFKRKPKEMATVVLWTSSVLTFMAAIMLISTGLPAGLGMGIVGVIFAIAQSLYCCWLSRRLHYAGEIISKSLEATNKVPGDYVVSYWILLVAALWQGFWIFGLVGALSYKYAALIVLALLVNLAWTMEVLRNILHTTVAGVVAGSYASGSVNTAKNTVRSSFRRAYTSLFGSICLGSCVVPFVHGLRMTGVALQRIESENEFMFSCVDCFSGVMENLIRSSNYWAYVQIALYGKGFVKASQDTWDLLKIRKMDVLLNADLTSSLCVLSGVAGGMVCVLAGGIWTFATHKALTASVSTIAFIFGYSLVRIAMAVVQASVYAHYICYAENSESSLFEGSPVPERLNELLPKEETAV